jgi:hypothetical protein
LRDVSYGYILLAQKYLANDPLVRASNTAEDDVQIDPGKQTAMVEGVWN